MEMENVLKKFKMNIYVIFICLYLKFMGMKIIINVYYYVNSEVLRELENKKLNCCLS